MSDSRYDDPYTVDVDVNTLLAALRYYQEHGQGEPANRSLEIHDIATGNDSQVSMDANGIDDLCEALNMGRIILVDSIKAKHALDDVFELLVGKEYQRLQVKRAEVYLCTHCGRPEEDCSADPCADVILEREEG